MLQGHPNVVQVENIFEDDDYVHIIMELCHGRELHHNPGFKAYTEHQAGYNSWPPAQVLLWSAKGWRLFLSRFIKLKSIPIVEVFDTTLCIPVNVPFVLNQIGEVSLAFDQETQFGPIPCQTGCFFWDFLFLSTFQRLEHGVPGNENTFMNWSLQVKQIMSAALGMLATCHAQEFLHRDIKPGENSTCKRAIKSLL